MNAEELAEKIDEYIETECKKGDIAYSYTMVISALEIVKMANFSEYIQRRILMKERGKK